MSLVALIRTSMYGAVGVGLYRNIPDVHALLRLTGQQYYPQYDSLGCNWSGNICRQTLFQSLWLAPFVSAWHPRGLLPHTMATSNQVQYMRLRNLSSLNPSSRGDEAVHAEEPSNRVGRKPSQILRRLRIRGFIFIVSLLFNFVGGLKLFFLRNSPTQQLTCCE
jgi:hypothetical protein